MMTVVAGSPPNVRAMYQPDGEGMVVPFIKNLGRLYEISQEQGVPLVCIQPVPGHNFNIRSVVQYTIHKMRSLVNFIENIHLGEFL